jgi:hypothetical protein
MIRPIEAIGLEGRVSFSVKSLEPEECAPPVVENFKKARGPRGHVSLSEEVPSNAPPTRKPQMGMASRSQVQAGFLKASSPELERQLHELVAGKIEELPKPVQGTRRVILAVPPYAGERRFCLQLGDALTRACYRYLTDTDFRL